MSWSRRAFVLTAVAGLGACGFEPVYGRRPDDADGLPTELAAIRLPDARSTLEFTLRQELVRQLNPTGLSVPTRFRLDWRLARRIENLAIQLDGVVTRQDLTLAATYALFDLGEGRVVDRGRVQRTASFNIRREPFSDQVARDDAERRASAAVAVALRQRLVAHFAQVAV